MNRPLVIVLAVLVLGILIMGSQADMRVFLSGMPAFRVHMDEKNEDFQGDVELSGKVEWIEENNGKSVFRTDCGSRFGTVNIYLDKTLISEKECFRYIGSRIRVRGDLFLYQRATNPGEFDLRSYYEADGVFLAMSADRMTLLSDGGNNVKSLFYRLYEKGAEILKTYADASDLAFFCAMLTGKREGLDEAFRNNLSALFLFRLFSVSGFFVSSVGMLIVRLLKKRSANPLIPASTGFLSVLLYCLMLGTPISFLRSVLVFGVRVFAPSVKRSADTLSAASFSLILLLLHRPMLLFQAGLQYYLAVLFSFALMVPAVRKTFRKTGFFFRTFLSLLSSAAVLLPLQAYHSYAVSPYGMILPLFLLPLRFFVVLFLLIGVFAGLIAGPSLKPLIDVLFFPPHVLRLFFETAAEAFRTLPFSAVVLGRPDLFRIFIYYVLIAGYTGYFQLQLVIRKYTEERKEKRFTEKAKILSVSVLFLLLVFGVFFLNREPLRPDESVYTMLDVGQGDGNLILTSSQTTVIDIGSSDRDDSGEVLKNALLFYGVSRIDTLVFTHGDLDHVGGFQALLHSGMIAVSEIWIPVIRDRENEFSDVLRLSAQYGIPVRSVQRGDRIRFDDGSVISVLWPKKNADLSGNAASFVLDYRRSDLHMLFTGDIGEAEEEAVLSDLSPVDVLKVAHHGSRYSSSAAFLYRLKPRFAFISYGKRNRYGHPGGETLARLDQVKTRVFQTGKDGAIEFRAGLSDERLICYGRCE